MGVKIRESNFELLRIIAMLMIVIHHFCYHGLIMQGWNTNITTLNHINNLLLQILNMGGKIGVNVFVLITGYFLINTNANLKSFLKIFLMTFMYSILILGAAAIYGDPHIQKSILKYAFNPLSDHNYWFIATYLILYIFAPFYNKFINALTQKEYLIFIILGLIIWSILGIQYSNLSWFFLMYAIGAFVSKFNPPLLNTKNSFILMSLSFLCVMMTFMLKFFDNPINLKTSGMNNILIFLISISLFCIFKNIKIPYNKYINSISASIFAVYLIHENKIVRPFLWQKLIIVNNFIDEPYFVVTAIIFPIIVFATCIIFDKIFAKLYGPIIEYISNSFSNLKILPLTFIQRNKN